MPERPPLTPPPSPATEPPSPPGRPSALPAPPASRAVAIPTYRKPARKPSKNRTSMLTLALMITAPAVFAVAVLRPRSSR
ncbi:hypothetical protein [Streptomyces candidus]|uniref:Proline-rich protein n=1 Tax=Streptomyces candidus TaxID=67283 RepID=A0A7X0LRK1_9ACTN|nr:hypothetical protein [Streptomyces candidus]MBB6438733.1 hypothetical protein [Streptomyces candidus]GHH53188.1 hypothetical protein GCM10018773_54400 [Streptomyces candidus]